MPSVGRKLKQKKYLKTWLMEPLAIAQLASLTPSHVDVEFFDDRLELIDYENNDADLIAINIETYTARRAYEIARKFKEKGKKIIMGGFHATLNHEEVLEHVDSVLIGEAENIWKDIIKDFEDGNLKKIYKAEQRPKLDGLSPDRSIYKGKEYLKLGLIEAGRGCYFSCNFCSVTNFYKHSYTARPVEDIIKEVKELNYRYYFFVNDNICADFDYAKKLFKALIPLKIKWISQASINISKDKELLRLMKESGCIGVLIGFESLSKSSLEDMGKPAINKISTYEKAIDDIYEYGIGIYATFVFGYTEKDEYYFEKTYEFARRNKFLLVAFNHLVPFPGTPLYKKLEKEGRLLYKKWWLEPHFRFGDVAFRPQHMSPEKLSFLCHVYRKKFYSFSSFWYRFFNFKTSFRSLGSMYVFFLVNIISKMDVRKRKGLPLGKK
jgi:radical SAM superfamily enzyme YgiQ (UPF0313 family)